MVNKARPVGLLPLAVLSFGLALAQHAPETGTKANTEAKEPAQSTTPETSAKPAPDFEDRAWRVLWLGLHDHRAARRTEAVKALSLLDGNRRAVTFALRALNDKNSRVRTAAAASLGDLHATNAIPALRAELSDKDASVMLAATHALYLLKDPSSYEIYYAILMGDKKTSQGLIQAQVERLKDPKQVAQMGFEEGLGFVPFGGMGYEAYRTIRKHDSSPVRAAAARFLALDPDSVAEDALIQTALADKNIIVRQAAIDALAQRGDPQCIERLAQNLSDPKPPVRYRTAAAIIHLGKTKTTRPGAQ